MAGLIWPLVLTGALGALLLGVLLWAMASVQRERTRAAVDWGRRLLEAQEEERRGIARELHDGVVPNLEAIALQMSRQAPDVAPGMLHDTAQQLRTLSRGLHPGVIDHLTLCDALRQLVANETSDACAIALECGILPDLDFPSRLAGYRIVQEALTNARRHAGARNVTVGLRRNEADVELTVRDDGAGFVVPPADRLASLGLRSMRERASALGGSLSITSAPGAGTTIHAIFPLRNGAR